MKRIFVDANIVVDLLCQDRRCRLHRDAQQEGLRHFRDSRL